MDSGSQASSPPKAPRNSEWSRYQRWVVNVVIIVGAFMTIRACSQRNLANGTAVDFQGKSLDGQMISLRDYRGKPVLLHFWATWCGVCSAMADNVEAIARDYPVVTVASQSGDSDSVRAYVTEHKLSFPVVNDPDGRLAQSYGVSAFPTTFIIDKAGKIRHAEVGFTTEIGLRIRAFLSTD